MDKTQIITLVMNAVITIVTTAVVLRLSLNKGKLNVASKVKARLTPKFKAYTKIILNILVIITLAIYLLIEIGKTSLPSRADVFTINLNMFALMIWFSLLVRHVKNLTTLKEQEKAQASKTSPSLPTK